MRPRPTVVRTTWIAAVVLGIVVALAWAFRPQPVTVTVGEVSRGHLAETVLDEGRTRIHDRYRISAPVSAHAPRIDLHVGDPVTQGQVLARLAPTRSAVLDPRSRAEAEARRDQAEAALRSARTQVQAAEADAEFAESELDRIRELFEDGSISRNELDRVEAQARRARAQLASARSAVDVAKAELKAAEDVLAYSGVAGEGEAERVEVVSPIDGEVLAVVHESEGVVQAGAHLLTLGDPDSLEVEVDVLSRDAVRIRAGMRVILERWGGERPLDARVRVVEPAGFTKVSALGVEEQRVLVICDIVSPEEEWDALGDGYRVEARFVLWESDDVLRVPESALFKAPGAVHEAGSSVFVVEEGVARLREVRTGHRGGLDVEVLEGLEEGERVILYPGESLEDGTPVEAR